METLLLMLGLIVGLEQTASVAPAETTQVVYFFGEEKHYNMPYTVDRIPPAAKSSEEPELDEVAAVVAACESGNRLSDGTAEVGSHDWTVENPSPSSSASGAFQFLTGTWEWVWEDIIGERAPSRRAMHADPEDQIRAFEALWDDGDGAHHWDASRSCWGRMIP